jgi:hypothetical protein
VYIAGSQQQRILKVGLSENPDVRVDHLNRLRYGSAYDWRILLQVRCNRAGAIENSLLSRHRRFSVFGEYWRDRKYQQCFELLRCNYSALRASLSQILDRETMQRCWEQDDADAEYEFGV